MNVYDQVHDDNEELKLSDYGLIHQMHSLDPGVIYRVH